MLESIVSVLLSDWFSFLGGPGYIPKDCPKDCLLFEMCFFKDLKLVFV